MVNYYYPQGNNRGINTNTNFPPQSGTATEGSTSFPITAFSVTGNTGSSLPITTISITGNTDVRTFDTGRNISTLTDNGIIHGSRTGVITVPSAPGDGQFNLGFTIGAGSMLLGIVILKLVGLGGLFGI